MAVGPEHQSARDDYDEQRATGADDASDGGMVTPPVQDRAEPALQFAMTGAHGTIIQSFNDLYLSLSKLVQSIPVDDDEVRRAVTRFADPPGFGNAREMLRARSVVVLSGPVGTGRRTAALNLLAGCQDAALRELLPEWTVPRTDDLPCEPSQGNLLDLTNKQDEIAESFARELLDHARRLATARGYLVITTTPQQWRQCARLAEEITVSLRRPGVKGVLHTHLEHLEPSGPRTAWLDGELAQFVSRLEEQETSLQDLVDLAHRLLTVTNLSEELHDIEQEMRRWKEHLDQQFGGNPPESLTEQRTLAQRRALLIACAVLDGLPTSVIAGSAQRLLMEIRAAPQPADLLVMPDLAFVCDAIKADRFGADTLSIATRRHGVDDAVLDRVWMDRPLLRGHLWTWLAAITTEQGPAVQHAERVATALTRFALRHRSLDILEVIQGWLEQARTRRLAVAILEDLATSADLGSAVRQRLYQWAAATGTSKAVLAGVAEACGGKLGEQFPAIALTRLRLIALQADTRPVRIAVGAALRRLASHAHLRRAVTAAVTGWLQEPATRPAGSVGLLALLEPDGDDAIAGQLVADAAVDPALRDRLHAGWLTLLQDDKTEADATALTAQWYASADSDVLDQVRTVEFLAPLMRTVVRSGGPIAVLFDHAKASTTRELVARRVIEWDVRTATSAIEIASEQERM